MDRFRCFIAAFIAASGLWTGQSFAGEIPASAPNGYGLGPDGAEGKWLARMEELQLTPEQRQAMQEIADHYRALGTEAAQRASGIREQFLAVSPDDPGYENATAKASEAASLLAADTVRLLSALRAEVHAVLSDEQRQQLKERMTEERARWDEWRNRHKSPQ